jgi:co-chaperonin GroES (HSP10)
MELQLLYDHVFIDPDQEEASKVTEGKLITNISERYIYGTVTHVGLGERVSGTNEILAIPLQVGNRVLYEHGDFDTITIDGKLLHIISAQNIIAIIGDKPLSEFNAEITERLAAAKQKFILKVKGE